MSVAAAPAGVQHDHADAAPALVVEGLTTSIRI